MIGNSPNKRAVGKKKCEIGNGKLEIMSRSEAETEEVN